MKNHWAFRPRSAFQASPVLALQNVPAPKPPKPPPAGAIVAIAPKPPPKAVLDSKGRAQMDSDGLVICEGGFRARPFANAGYIPPQSDPVQSIYSLVPKPHSGLEALLKTPEFAECAIGGTVVGLFPAREAHVIAAALLSAPQEHVTMTAFTFGEEDSGGTLNVALGRAANFVSVKILADERETLKGTTKRQALCLWSLVKLGVKVELVRKSKGQQHSKTLLIGSTLMLGSANWTSNSRNNHEMVLAVELDDRGRSRYYQLCGEMRSRSMNQQDFDSARAHQALRSASPKMRARSAEPARNRPMLSGREEPEQSMLQLVPLLRPGLLRGNPALGAASTRDADWSEIGGVSDPETEDTLGASPSVPIQLEDRRLVRFRPKTPPIPPESDRYAWEPQVPKQMKKRAVARGCTPRETEAPCPYSHPSVAKDVD